MGYVRRVRGEAGRNPVSGYRDSSVDFDELELQLVAVLERFGVFIRVVIKRRIACGDVVGEKIRGCLGLCLEARADRVVIV